jgi:hypothetical protein
MSLLLRESPLSLQQVCLKESVLLLHVLSGVEVVGELLIESVVLLREEGNGIDVVGAFVVESVYFLLMRFDV